MYGTRQHVCAQLEEGFSADTPLAPPTTWRRLLKAGSSYSMTRK
nr:hypothetical protein [Hafnia alvei]